ncbi:hypothetical protein [Streptomyces sp. NPDC054854]
MATNQPDGWTQPTRWLRPFEPSPSVADVSPAGASAKAPEEFVIKQPIQSIVLVGNRFVGFAAQENVFTVSQFIDDLRRGAYATEGEPVLAESAQGVSESDVLLIVEELRHRGLDRVQIRLQPAALSGAGEVHKHQVANALIADLHQVSDSLFGAGLRLRNDNELLLDHRGAAAGLPGVPSLARGDDLRRRAHG